MNFLERLARRRETQRAVDHVHETRRVCDLPLTAEDKVAGAYDLTPLLKTPGGTFQLHPVQSAALEELAYNGGLLGPIGVGHGKTLIALLAATVLDAKMAIILAPASTIWQLREAQRQFFPHFKLIPKIYIYSYDQLSLAKNTNLLDRLCRPFKDSEVVLIADEAHRLKRLESARTKRLIRFFQRRPGVSFVALSGTLTSKSLRDFSHLAELALRENSPVPRDSNHLDAWSEAIDVQGRPNNQHWRMLEPLWRFYQQFDPKVRAMAYYRGERRRELIRRAFKTRLWSCPGVVATGKGSLGCSLLFHTLDSISVPREIREALERLASEVEDPAGEPLEDDVAVWRTGRCISQGFYYRWAWEKTESGVEDVEWLTARRTWARVVRAELNGRADEGYDSPLLVFQRISRQVDRGERGYIHKCWQAWDEQRQKAPPPTVPVWLSPYLIDWALEWAQRQREPVILWYEALAMEDALRKAGLPVYGAGMLPPTEATTCAMSIQAHGVGKNLQAWRSQLVLSPPSSGKTWEQLLGRTHRFGQIADEVDVFVCGHTPQFADAIQSAFRDAQYIEHTSGNRQKLLFATLARSGMA